MPKARKNPLGIAFPGATTVRVGVGEHVHLYDPIRGLHLCRSGRNAGRKGGSGVIPKVYKTDGAKVTCYRCIKLGKLNQAAGRKPWQGN